MCRQFMKNGVTLGEDIVTQQLNLIFIYLIDIDHPRLQLLRYLPVKESERHIHYMEGATIIKLIIYSEEFHIQRVGFSFMLEIVG